MERITAGIQDDQIISRPETSNSARLANIQEQQTDMAGLYKHVQDVHADNNVQKVLSLLLQNINQCSKLIDNFRETYEDWFEKQNKKSGLLGKIVPKNTEEVARARGAYETTQKYLEEKLNDVTTALNSFNEAIQSITLKDELAADEVNKIVNTFNRLIQDIKDEIIIDTVDDDKILNMKRQMKKLSDELSLEIKLDANDKLEEKFAEIQEKLIKKAETFVLEGRHLIDSTFDFSQLGSALPQASTSSRYNRPAIGNGRYIIKGSDLTESSYRFN